MHIVGIGAIRLQWMSKKSWRFGMRLLGCQVSVALPGSRTRVRLSNGPLAGLEGILVETDDNGWSWSAYYLEAIGGVKIERDWAE